MSREQEDVSILGIYLVDILTQLSLQLWDDEDLVFKPSTYFTIGYMALTD